MKRAFPVLTLSGTPYEMGFKHGRLARSLVTHNIRLYFERFEKEWDLTSEDLIYQASKYLTVIAETSQEYLAQLEGLRDGSGVDLLSLVALNVRYEIGYSRYVEKFMAGGVKGEAGRQKGIGECTSFALLPEVTVENALIMGKNWDWISGVAVLLLKIERPDGLKVLGLTEAGIVGAKMGLNTAGLGMVINGLVSDKDRWDRLGKPFHVHCWEILGARELKEAADILKEDKRSCSANYLIGKDSGSGEGEVLDVEAAPESLLELRPEGGFLVHSNHFVKPEALNIREPMAKEDLHTYDRYGRLQDLLNLPLSEGRKVSVAYLKKILQDHKNYPYSLCYHEDRFAGASSDYQTVISVIMNLHERRLWTTYGPPCENLFHHFRLQKSPSGFI